MYIFYAPKLSDNNNNMFDGKTFLNALNFISPLVCFTFCFESLPRKS